MRNRILVHDRADDVGVAVADLKAGEEPDILTLDGESVGRVRLADDIPWGHKVALRELAVGKTVIEYGRAIGAAVQPVRSGAHVHVHNLKSLRWTGQDRTTGRPEVS
jgi:(2R)-sulfolactate sulfo-lyase subunit alpha